MEMDGGGDGGGVYTTSRHITKTIRHHRLIAVFLFAALCLTIVVAVVWKTTGLTTSQAALDTDCFQQLPAEEVQQLAADGVQQLPAEGSQQLPGDGFQQLLSDEVHEPKPDHDGDDGLDHHQEVLTEADNPEGHTEPSEPNPVISESEAQADEVSDKGRTEPSETNAAVSESATKAEEIAEKERIRHALEAIISESGLTLNEQQMKILEMDFDPTIPSYAVDEHGRPHEWVLKGPDMFDKVCMFDKAAGNLPSRRFMWFAHMNRKDETTSLYNQLGIDQSCSEAWVPIAINTAKEIRRIIMRYFVYYEINALECDMGPWDNIKHSAPDNVQHRMNVFVAKLEYVEPFHHLRQVTQNVCEGNYPWNYYREYFQYQHDLRAWMQKYEHLHKEVDELCFEGCTRAFQIPHRTARAAEFIAECIDLNVMDLLSSRAPTFLAGWLVHACRLGYENLDFIPEDVRAALLRLKETKVKIEKEVAKKKICPFNIAEAVEAQERVYQDKVDPVQSDNQATSTEYPDSCSSVQSVDLPTNVHSAEADELHPQTTQ